MLQRHTAGLENWHARRKTREAADFDCPVCPTLGIFSLTLTACADIQAFVSVPVESK
jgi:hypothetical protein